MPNYTPSGIPTGSTNHVYGSVGNFTPHLGSNPIKASVSVDENGNYHISNISGASGIDGLALQVMSPILQAIQPFYDIGNRLNSGIFWMNAGGLVLGSILSILAVKELMSMGK